MLNTCAAEVAIFSDVESNLDDLLLSAVCAAEVAWVGAWVGATAVVIRIEPLKLEEDQLWVFLKWLQGIHLSFPNPALKIIFDLSRNQALVIERI